MEHVKFMVDKSLEEGWPFSYILNTYVSSKGWMDLISNQINYGVLYNATEYNYSRCFSFLILENIKLPGGLYSNEAKKFIIERGRFDTLSIQISAIAPCAIVERRRYVPNGNKLEYPIIEKFNNEEFEQTYEAILTLLKEKEISVLSRKELEQPLKGVKVENIEDEDVTYLNYLFE